MIYIYINTQNPTDHQTIHAQRLPVNIKHSNIQKWKSDILMFIVHYFEGAKVLFFFDILSFFVILQSKFVYGSNYCY